MGRIRFGYVCFILASLVNSMTIPTIAAAAAPPNWSPQPFCPPVKLMLEGHKKASPSLSVTIQFQEAVTWTENPKLQEGVSMFFAGWNFSSTQEHYQVQIIRPPTDRVLECRPRHLHLQRGLQASTSKRTEPHIFQFVPTFLGCAKTQAAKWGTAATSITQKFNNIFIFNVPLVMIFKFSCNINITSTSITSSYFLQS